VYPGDSFGLIPIQVKGDLCLGVGLRPETAVIRRQPNLS